MAGSAEINLTKDGTLYPMTPAEIGCVCHEANRAYRSMMNEDPGPDWENATHTQRVATIQGVQNYIDNPNQTPEQSHQQWYDHYDRLGFKYGPVKDLAKKEHPCFLPYDQLPLFQRRKDELFRAIVLTLLKG
jgi:hypothetical protein